MKLKIEGDSYNVFPPENRAFFHARNFEGYMFSEHTVKRLQACDSFQKFIGNEGFFGNFAFFLNFDVEIFLFFSIESW